MSKVEKRVLFGSVFGAFAYAVVVAGVCSSGKCKNIRDIDPFNILAGAFVFIGISLLFFVVIPGVLGAFFNKNSTDRPHEEGLSPQEEAMLNAIKEQKKSTPHAGVKIGSMELVERLTASLKDEKGVHVESLLAILGSLAGYSCHVALREELIDTGKLKENEVFTVVTGADGRTYYFGEAPNKPLVSDELSVWACIGGELQGLGVAADLDLNALFSEVASSVGGEEFGLVNIDEKHKPGDLPLSYVKSAWGAFLPMVDKFCDRPMQRPLLFALAIQQVLGMGKDVIPPLVAAELVMKCAIPMSKIGPEWLE